LVQPSDGAEVAINTAFTTRESRAVPGTKLSPFAASFMSATPPATVGDAKLVPSMLVKYRSVGEGFCVY
jgi:hypothetical protein